MAGGIIDWLKNLFKEEASKSAITRVVVKYDAGFGNKLYIRGDGANLNWKKGVLMQNVASDRWVFETDFPFKKCAFKVLINDERYETGDNHLLVCGHTVQVFPKF
jgi:hypothetical protein